MLVRRPLSGSSKRFGHPELLISVIPPAACFDLAGGEFVSDLPKCLFAGPRRSAGMPSFAIRLPFERIWQRFEDIEHQPLPRNARAVAGPSVIFR
jgi:hypothetical protein